MYAGDLTAGDSYKGYVAHSPQNDNGVIQPTAAISSMPYTPKESMQALRYFYDELGNKIWSKYGFVDGFSIHHNWYAKSHLAIDQGPISDNDRELPDRLIMEIIYEYTGCTKWIEEDLVFTSSMDKIIKGC